MALLGLGNDFARRVVAGPFDRHVGAMPGEGGDEPLASAIRAILDMLGHRGQEAAHGLVLGIQLLVVHIVGRPNQFVDACRCIWSHCSGIDTPIEIMFE